MPAPPGWNPEIAVHACPAGPWRGTVWRGHRQQYPAISDTGSRLFSGRYHRARDCFPKGPVWAALYLALAPETAVLEIARQYPPDAWPPRNYRFTAVHLELQAVRDCRDPALLHLSFDDLCGDAPDDECHSVTWEIPRSVAEAAINLGDEAILVPSASRRGANLILFPDRMRPGSAVRPTDEFFDPRFSREV